MSCVCILLLIFVTLLEHDLLSGLLTADHHVLCLYPTVDIGHLVNASLAELAFDS